MEIQLNRQWITEGEEGGEGGKERERKREHVPVLGSRDESALIREHRVSGRSSAFTRVRARTHTHTHTSPLRSAHVSSLKHQSGGTLTGPPHSQHMEKRFKKKKNARCLLLFSSLPMTAVLTRSHLGGLSSPFYSPCLYKAWLYVHTGPEPYPSAVITRSQPPKVFLALHTSNETHTHTKKKKRLHSVIMLMPMCFIKTSFASDD